MRHLVRGVVCLTLGLLAGASHADLWGYVDAKGVAHFAPRQLDARYELFVRGDLAPSAGVRTLSPATAPARAVAVPTVPGRLLAFFDVSTNYKAVRHHMRQASLKYRVDYDLIKAVIATESGFDPQAISPRGAVGLMQLMPATAARWLGPEQSADLLRRRLLEPDDNIEAGTRYLAHLLERYKGNVEIALAAYNAGEGSVARAGQKIPDIEETRQYVQTVLTLYQVLKPPMAVATGPAWLPPSRAAMPTALPAAPSLAPPPQLPVREPQERNFY
jgi:soluble lytic murein transglycosylase-like protein